MIAEHDKHSMIECAIVSIELVHCSDHAPALEDVADHGRREKISGMQQDCIGRIAFNPRPQCPKSMQAAQPVLRNAVDSIRVVDSDEGNVFPCESVRLAL